MIAACADKENWLGWNDLRGEVAMDRFLGRAWIISVIATLGLMPRAHGQIETFLFSENNRGETRYEELRGPQVSLFNGVNLPNGGIGKYFDAGYTVGPRVFLPLGPGLVIGNTFSQWGFNGGFNYAEWESNGRFQLNQPGGKDFGIGDFQSYTGELGVGWRALRPFGDRLAFCWNAGINSVLGGISGSTPVTPYNPSLTQVTLNGDPNPSAFLAGFGVTVSTGVQLPNGMQLSIGGIYTGFGSNVVTGQQQYSDSFTVGAHVSVPLRSLRRIPYINRLFRNPTREDPRELLLMVTPRIIVEEE